MDRKQQIAVGALPLLTVTMVAVYQLVARLLGKERAWLVGFLVYWPVWCFFLPLKLLGLEKMRALFGGARPTRLAWFMLLFPASLAILGRLFQDKGRRSPREKLKLTLMAPLNGTLEELLWRGLYLSLFPDRTFWGLWWPTLWFALWHYAPGSVSPLTAVWTLMAGAAVFGAGLGWLTRRTGSIRWAAASHTLAGLVHVLS